MKNFSRSLLHRNYSIAICCSLLSVFAYTLIFLSIDKPLTVGVYDKIISTKTLALSNASKSPRVLLLGGSNIRYSHSAVEMSQVLALPVVNGGLSADLAPRIIFNEYRPLLRRGDVVYIALEYEAYCHNFLDSPTDAFFITHYRLQDMTEMGFDSVIKCLAAYDLNYLFSGIAETLLYSLGFKSPFTRQMLNSVGDQIGHTREAADSFTYTGAILAWQPPTADSFKKEPSGNITDLVDFIRWADKEGIDVIGGLPTTPNHHLVPRSVIRKIRDIFISNNAAFIQLDSNSQLPAEWFYDSPYHLCQEHQIDYTRILSQKLRAVILPAE